MRTNWKDIPKYALYINGTCVREFYSLNKAIDLAQRRGGSLWGQRKCEVVNVLTGEVVYQIN